jgi:hypothetical protein
VESYSDIEEIRELSNKYKDQLRTNQNTLVLFIPLHDCHWFLVLELYKWYYFFVVVKDNPTLFANMM